jgi:AhpD family alkylhydroperoxidase
VAVAYSNSCQYCLAAHTAIGGMLGLSPSQLEAAYTADSTDPQIAAALHFAQQLVQNQGYVSDEEVAKVRQAGYGNAEIPETVGHLALNVFTNYFNTIAQTDLDFPRTARSVPRRS